MQTAKILFLHGLESSSQGTKARFFADNFPQVVSPDFSGDLEERLQQLEEICSTENDLNLIGSSFGGLMAARFALKYPERIARLTLLAPALNYGNYCAPKVMLPIPTIIIMGKNDTVTPADKVIPLAEKTFSNLKVQIEDDDHMLHNSFKQIDWEKLLGSEGGEIN